MWQGIKNIYHLFCAYIANILYGFPSRKLIVIGVTGTDGKTTTTSLIYHILNASGHQASMVSSVGAIIGGKEHDVGFHVTTPSSFALQKFLKQAVGLLRGKNKGYMVLETTSHALDQYRAFGINFEVGVLTNVTHEHLDYHKTYEKYVEAKSRLIKMSKTAVINRDDESYESIKYKRKVITYGLSNNSDINPKKFPFKTKLIGEFNKYNILAAISACKAVGISDKDIVEAIATFNPPIGREEIVYNNEFAVMIDFAHTPNAFEQILSSVRKETKGRVIHIFGSAGQRDRSKRPIMGKISSQYSDVIILTSEDPRSENVEKIMTEIELGIRNHELGVNFFKISDRKKAIKKAVEIAKKGDLVILTGKSHEKSMNYGKGEEPWSEYEAVQEVIRDKGQATRK